VHCASDLVDRPAVPVAYETPRTTIIDPDVIKFQRAQQEEESQHTARLASSGVGSESLALPLPLTRRNMQSPTVQPKINTQSIFDIAK
jgi:hypothetical protein